jgi:tellurite resistance protein TerC
MTVWIIFISLILLFLALDLGVFNRKAHIIGSKEALIWTSIWVTLSMLFSVVVYFLYKNQLIDNPTRINPETALIKYITGYLIELSLSVDNIFVIAVIFNAFRIPRIFQHRVLFWGILGAIVFRALMILFGVILINKFSWMIYVFGAFLIFTALKMLTSHDKEYDPSKSFINRAFRKIFPLTDTVENEHFFVRKGHIIAATPLFLVLLIIEATDVLFALDSIPAILAITADPFLVFSSNIFAILGLRSMYFLLSDMIERFSYLRYSLVAILIFVGIKMIISHHVHWPEWFSLSFIALALGIGILFSLRKKQA